jgi:CBS domain containing-hemolysin-like protein
MEDILEEVTGEIQDEFDEESEITFRKIDDFTYLFEGLTLLNDVSRITGLSPSVFDQIKGNADTLAGLALELQGDIPIAGSVIEWEGYSFTVTRADNRRIHQIRMSLPR